MGQRGKKIYILIVSLNIFLYSFIQYLEQIESSYKKKEEINDCIIENLKDCLLSFSKINQTEREMTEQVKVSLEAEVKKMKTLLVNAYEELDTAQTELHSIKTDLIYMKAVVERIKRKYPNEDLRWAMRDNDA